MQTQRTMDGENKLLDEEARKRYVLCCNRKENDENWNSSDPQWVGKASMAERHRFMTVRDLDWRLFNALTMGIEDHSDLQRAIVQLEDMLAVARNFVQKADGWSKNVGFFFHVFPQNSVQSLHLHIVDLDVIGPTYHAVRAPAAPAAFMPLPAASIAHPAQLSWKNMPAEDVLAVLRAEADNPS